MPIKTLAIFIVLLTFGGPLVASPATDQLQYELQATDCGFLKTDHAIDLLVLDKRFPLPRGFNFYGFELHYIAFRKFADIEQPVHTNKHSRSAASDLPTKLSMPEASVVYYKSKDDEDTSGSDSESFEQLEWHGISFLYRVSDGGRVTTTTTHQVIVGTDDQDERLVITSLNPKDIANIIACASDH